MNEEYISLIKDLAEHPKMFEQIKKMLATVKSSDGKIMSAHEAEQQIIDDIRVLGKETKSWANEQNKKAGTNYRKKVKEVRLNGKKNSIGTTFGSVEVEELMFFDKARKQRFRPFSILAGIGCREYSIPLQKAITDFGADVPFNKINSKLKKHYGIEVPIDSARKVTEHHGHEIKVMEKDFIKNNEAKAIIIGEIDGSMVPLVSYDKKPLNTEEKFDKRKYKSTYYKKMRLSLAHKKGSATPIFAGIIGSTEEAGQKL